MFGIDFFINNSDDSPYECHDTGSTFTSYGNKNQLVYSNVEVNLQSDTGIAYATMDIVIIFNKPSMHQFFMRFSECNPRGMQERIKATIMNAVSSSSVNQVITDHGKVGIALKIKRLINEMLYDKTEGVIFDVYFSKFLVKKG